MDFQLDSEQRMIQELIRQMVDRKIIPIMKSHDTDKPLPKDAVLKIFKLCAEQGLTSARVPEEVRWRRTVGAEFRLDARAIAAGDCAGVDRARGNRREAMSVSTPEQQERFLPDIIAANKIACTGNTEPDVGSRPEKHQDSRGRGQGRIRHHRPQDVDHQRQHLRSYQRHLRYGQGRQG